MTRAFIKSTVTRKDLEDIGVCSKNTFEQLLESKESFHGEFETFKGYGEVFSFKDSRLPSIMWVDADMVEEETNNEEDQNN